MYNNYPSDKSKKICTVTAVDITRKVCKCISDLGEIMSDVRWLIPVGGTDGSGSSCSPMENSKVLVDISTGFPFILGSIHNESADIVRRPNIGRQDVDEPVIADYTTITTGDLVRGQGTPRDQRVGDILNTTDGGAIQGVLSSGTVINKASPLAQILCSRYGDLVRVVSRNNEHFTDVDKTIKTSIRGSLYTRNDLYRDPVRSRDEVPSMVRYSGNVQAAELIEDVASAGYTDDNDVHHAYTYASIPVSLFPNIPEDNYIVEKEYIYNNSTSENPRVPVSISDTSIEGEYTHKIQTTDKSIYSYYTWNNSSKGTSFTNPDDESAHRQDAVSETTMVRTTDDVHISNDSQTSIEHSKNVQGGDKTNWRMNETEFHWGVLDDTILIHGNSDGIVINVAGNVIITAGSNGDITVTNTGDTSITTDGNLDVTAQDTEFNLANCVFNTSGTTTFNSAGNFTVSAPIVAIN